MKVVVLQKKLSEVIIVADYINRDILIQKIRHMPRTINPDLVQYSLVKGIILNIEQADVAPVVHGRWLPKETVHIGLKEYMCSECVDWNKYYCRGDEKYCPNCGARMEQE